ncbi:MAG: zinc ribbon domain-containing protein [Betaproteobacteria bacterium]|nr:zinc ribbon domain-containing protein [Betaproteobacteria bacterium]
MPLYDYAPQSGQCKQCHGRFEVMQRLADPKLAHCPVCKQSVVRLISAAAVHSKFSMAPSKLNDLGMTKYVKTSDGSYTRTVGEGGPKMIREPK